MIRCRHPGPPSAPPIEILVLGIIISWTIKFRANIKILLFPFFIPLLIFYCVSILQLLSLLLLPSTPDSLQSFLFSSLSQIHFLIILILLQLIWNLLQRFYSSASQSSSVSLNSRFFAKFLGFLFFSNSFSFYPHSPSTHLESFSAFLFFSFSVFFCVLQLPILCKLPCFPRFLQFIFLLSLTSSRIPSPGCDAKPIKPSTTKLRPPLAVKI
jgi:hypothetical protein